VASGLDIFSGGIEEAEPPRSIEARPMGLSAEPDAADGADPLGVASAASLFAESVAFDTASSTAPHPVSMTVSAAASATPPLRMWFIFLSLPVA